MLAKGVEIEGYRIERLLGKGGMGEVYEAVQLDLGRPVAFKVLHTGLIEDGSFRERFRREGRLQATLEHPNVVTVYEAGEIDEGLFLAMRLIDGATLKELIAAEGLDGNRTLSILAPVADALDTAHQKGLVHRDVKPQNILVGSGDHPFLADFGLTRGRDETAFTRSGHIVGTVDYISPEQVRGEPAGPASDVYALSAVLYECLTGSVPYALPTDAAVLYAHMNTEPPSVGEVRQDLPAGLDAVIAAGMAKEPDDRPASSGELIAAAGDAMGGDYAALKAPAAGGPGGRGKTTRVATTGRPSGESSSAPTREQPARPNWTVAAGVAAILALGALAWFAGRQLGGKEAAALTTSVSGGGVSFHAPGGWEATSVAERLAIPGLGLRNVIGAAPSEPNGSGVTAGMTDADGAALLPAPLEDRVVGALPKPKPVKLGRLEALRYRDLSLRGFDRDVTLYAAPSTAGVATMACYSLSGDFDGTCESIAQTLELTRGGPYPLAPSAGAQREISAALSGLGRERRAARKQLQQAGTAGGQAKAADQLADAYAQAQNRLDRADVSPVLAGSLGAIGSALTESGAGYRDLAAAARVEDGEAFATAEENLEESEANLAAALAALGRERKAG